MKKLSALFILLLSFSFSSQLFAQSNSATTPTEIFSSTTCTTTSGTLTGATYTTTGSGANFPGCGAANLDVWYTFKAQSTNPTITVTKTGSLTGTRAFQLYTGSWGSFTGSQCMTTGNTLTASGLTIGQMYLMRVYSGNTSPYDFTICVTDPIPANNTCATATNLTLGNPCSSTTGYLLGTNQTAPTKSCGNYWDVWYKFTAPASYAFASIAVTPSGSPSNINSTNTFVEVFGSDCTTNDKSIGCSNIGSSRSVAISSGVTYYFRVYTTVAPSGITSAYAFNVCITPTNQVTGLGGRMNEVFLQTILSGPNVLADPWEVTYGPDNNLWITESKGYKVYKMNPVTGAKDVVLDISQGSTFLTDATFNCQFANGNGAQGGLAGLALHPKFLASSGAINYAYVSYVYKYERDDASNASCKYFTNRLVRFTYDPVTKKFGSPVSLCDTLPGGNDHNSQRMIIVPVDGKDYLFYASGDMGGGQLNCAARAQKAQVEGSYEGKILRFNLDTDNDNATLTALDNWIPNDNPFNTTSPAKQSAVWVTGIRNNQGFAYDTSLGILYGSSHGPYSDDEINIIKRAKNYGHPLVIGKAADNNYANASAGTPRNSPVSTCPIITSEVTNAATIGSSYEDPIFTAYVSSPSYPSIYNDIWNKTSVPNNGLWPSEGWSGLDLYTNSIIPGWKQSLVAASLKWGRLVKLKLNTAGTSTLPNNTVNDTVSYFGSQNRFRDLAFSPNGKDIFVVMDRSTSTSGPSSLFPVVPGCQGCVQKYTFLGYNANNADANKSYIPTSIDIAPGKPDVFETANKVVINAANGNNNLWVPITDTSSNIIAEINARGNDLDTITTTLFTRSGTSRASNTKKYLNRNLTITPQKQPSSPVWIRLYIAKTELDAFKADDGVAGISNLKIIKNEDSATTAIASNTSLVNTTVAESFGTNGYVLQGEISSFSSFYFAPSFITLPLQLSNFRGSLRNEATLLQWETTNEVNTSHFVIERSINGQNFDPIGSVNALGNSDKNNYSYLDKDAKDQGVRVLYYRLRMIDQDNQYKYSDVISVIFKSASTVTIYPNPIEEEINLNVVLDKAERIQVTITDIQGNLIYRQTKQLSAGANLMKVNTKAWPSQTYTVQVVSSDKKPLITKKVVKF